MIGLPPIQYIPPPASTNGTDNNKSTNHHPNDRKYDGRICMIKTEHLVSSQNVSSIDPNISSTLRLYQPSNLPPTTTDVPETGPFPKETIESSLVDLLSDSFADSSILMTILSPVANDPSLCASFRRFFYERRLNLFYDHSYTLLSEERELMGHVAVEPPMGENHMAPSLWKLVRIGFLKLPFLYGMAVTKRLLSLTDQITAHQTEVLAAHRKPPGSFAIIEALAMASPKWQGRGVGRTVMSKVVHSMSSSHILLLTQEERNVRFYQRLGFVVLGERTIVVDEEDATAGSFVNWILWKEAETPSQTEITIQQAFTCG